MKIRSPFLLVIALASCIGLAGPAYASTPPDSVATPDVLALVAPAAPALHASFVIAPCAATIDSLGDSLHYSAVTTVHAAPRVRVAPTALAAVMPTHDSTARLNGVAASDSLRDPGRARTLQIKNLGLSLVGLSLMGLVAAVKSTSADKDTYPARDTVRQQHNLTAADLFYFLTNGVASTTLATLPQCARATTASKVKTTQATVLRESGVLVALGATDNYWTLTGANLAAGFFRRYLLIDTAGVASVIASSDAVTAAACVFSQLPAQGAAIVGILTIQNATNPFIPGTTLLSAAGVTDTYIDGHDGSPLLGGQVTP